MIWMMDCNCSLIVVYVEHYNYHQDCLALRESAVTIFRLKLFVSAVLFMTYTPQIYISTGVF